MKTKEQIEKEITQIRKNQEVLKQSGRNKEADYLSQIISNLQWVLN